MQPPTTDHVIVAAIPRVKGQLLPRDHIIIAESRHPRNNVRELRKAASACPLTRDIAETAEAVNVKYLPTTLIQNQIHIYKMTTDTALTLIEKEREGNPEAVHAA